MAKSTTTGRARRYPWRVDGNFESPEIEQQVALMGELIERAVDQLHDLPPQGLLFRPEGVWFSIAWLALHMSKSEHEQIRHLLPVTDWNALGQQPPQLGQELGERLQCGGIESPQPPPDSLADAAALAETMRSVYQEFTVPVCRRVADPDARLGESCLFATPRDLIVHMNWHWTYHSGQIGLLRLQWGDEYVWTLAERT